MADHDEACPRCDGAGWHECDNCDRGGPCGCPLGQALEAEEEADTAARAAGRYSPTDPSTWTRAQLQAELEARMGIRAPKGREWRDGDNGGAHAWDYLRNGRRLGPAYARPSGSGGAEWALQAEEADRD